MNKSPQQQVVQDNTLPDPEYDYFVKLIVVGDSGVGKSSLLHRFSDNVFSDQYNDTIGVDFKIKTITVDGKIVKVHVWDTAGQERFRIIVSLYYRGADGVMYVYDVTSSKTLHRISSFDDDVKKHTSVKLPNLLVGNKIESHRRVVTREAAEDVCRKYGIDGYIETSAKTGECVNDAYKQLVRNIINRRTKPVITSETKPQMKIVLDNQINEKSKCCA